MGDNVYEDEKSDSYNFYDRSTSNIAADDKEVILLSESIFKRSSSSLIPPNVRNSYDFLQINSILKNYMRKIFNILGGGYKEYIYRNAISNELRRLGYHLQKEITVSIVYNNEEVGTVIVDMIIDRMYIIEFKVIEKIGMKEINKIKRCIYLLEVDGIVGGFLINVGWEKYEIMTIAPGD